MRRVMNLNILDHRKQLVILRKMTLYMLTFYCLIVFRKRITNAAKTGNKRTVRFCYRNIIVYRQNCQNAALVYEDTSVI